MSENRKNVLICIAGLHRGGIEMSAMQFQQSMSAEKYHFIYYLHSSEENEALLKEKVIGSGAEIVIKPDDVRGLAGEYFYLKKLMKEKKIDIVHDHMGFHAGLTAIAAKRAGVPKRIAQSHWSKSNREVGFAGKAYRKLMKFFIHRCVTDMLACSSAAGRYIYGNGFDKHGVVVKNGIETEKYRFNPEKRDAKRRELGIENRLTVGHIGHIYRIKNQTYLVRVLKELLGMGYDAVLLLVGDTADNGDTEALAKELGVSDNVIFAGVRSDIPEILMAMDVLAFPSLFEALPIVPLEAQATGLPCLISDNVTRDVCVNDNVEYFSIERDAREWAEKIVLMAGGDREKVSTERLRSEFDSSLTARKMEEIYDG